MTKVKTNFAFHKVDVGLDVHKRSWNAAVFLDGIYVRNIHQPPSPQALHQFLTTNFPGAHYRCAYECGKFFFPDGSPAHVVATVMNLLRGPVGVDVFLYYLFFAYAGPYYCTKAKCLLHHLYLS